MTFFTLATFILLVFDFKGDRLLFAICALLFTVAPWFGRRTMKFQGPLVFKNVSNNRSRFARQTFLVAIYISALVVTFYGLVVIGLMGTPFKMWTFLYMSLAFLIVIWLLEFVFDEGFLALKLIPIIILGLMVHGHLNETKALWPNKEGEIFGLSARPYNSIHAAGWDWAEEWYRIPGSREDALVVVAYWRRQYPSRDGDDSLIRVPKRERPGSWIGGFTPYNRIDRPCEHWLVDDPCWIVQQPLHIYYDDVSESIIVTRVTDF